MISSTGTLLRLFLAGALLIAAAAAVLVFTGIIPAYYEREFSDDDFGPASLEFSLATYDDIDGWRGDDPTEALSAFMRSCEIFEKLSAETAANPLENKALTGVALGGTVADWQRPCHEARALTVSAYSDPSIRRGAIRKFFEFHFQPIKVHVKHVPLPDGPARRAEPKIEEIGVFTGYYEPVYSASHSQTERFSAPLLPRPDDLVEVDLGKFRDTLKGERIAGRLIGNRLDPYDDRRAIEKGNVPDEPIAWLDPNDLFFLQIQGSGRLVFEEGENIRVGYAGQNGHAYTAIGRVMVQREIMPLEAVSMQSIRQWLDDASPEDAQALREENASYVFFNRLDQVAPELGPLGAQGASLTPGRSLAVDRRYYPLGMPVWVDIEPQEGSKPLRRLMIAQDTGGAIRGPIRGDYFWGSGDEAAAMAGGMNAKGKMVILLPRRLAETLQLRGRKPS
ncbi:murein transglycosylase A [Hyphococcus lacteus]|uniref:peptidoglycan lytic exotransglycosylase n=1 Tax=Hyphococcus lacteus TaxID=3143536 RepID=A0ABV3Z2L6_9PROT